VENKDANNVARALFRQSIIDMFGGADWKNYDREAIRKIENDLARPHRLEEAANALPEDTRLDVDVDVSFGINVDNFVM
jgi:hypothetical protein